MQIEHLQHDFQYVRACREDQVLQIRAMTEDTTNYTTKYSFHRPNNTANVHHHVEQSIYEANDAAMKYTNLDKNNRRQDKGNKSKRSSTRRRAESMRNFSSDMESDTGSDGLAVNSEGSGRSGDWGPPQLRRKPKGHRKRAEVRMSYTDSGISLSKTDLESLSGLSVGTHHTPDRHIGRNGLIMHTAESKTSTVDSLPDQHNNKDSLEFHSLSPIAKRPSTTNESHTTDSGTPASDEAPRPSVKEIEEKEQHILQQCLKNEQLTNAGNASKNGVNGDTADIQCRESRFPLPDHLNYPICRYRNKSESDNRLHPLKKLRDGWRKLRERKRLNKTDSSGDTDCYPEFYPAYVQEDDDSEVILSRLSRNPNERKNFARRIFARFGSKSYSVSNDKVRDNVRRISRSGSTLSVPDALQDMWKKAHPDIPCNQPLPSRPLHKVNSMPSINTNSQKENKENIFLLPQSHNDSLSTDQNPPPTNPNELRRTLSGLQITSDKYNNGAENKGRSNNKTMHYYDELKVSCSVLPGETTNSLVRSSSCHELYNRSNKKGNSNYNQVPQQQMYFTPTPCTCCIPSQMPGQMQTPIPGQPMQYMNMPFYAYPNYVYPIPSYGGYPMEFVSNYYNPTNFYQPGGEHGYPVMSGVVPVDNVLAPLNVKVEHDKKAEKRKIADINFDTFV